VPITGQILMAVRTVASVSRPRAERLGFVRLVPVPGRGRTRGVWRALEPG